MSSAQEFLNKINKEVQKDSFTVEIVDSNDASTVYGYSSLEVYDDYPLEGKVWEQAFEKYKQKK